MTSRPALLPALAGPGLPPAPGGDRRFTLGLDTVDARLGGGLAMAALHEFYAQGEGDAASVAAFALLLALRCGRPGPVLWLREDHQEAFVFMPASVWAQVMALAAEGTK